MTNTERQDERLGRELKFLVPLGRVAVFYVPAHKLHESALGREGLTPAELFERFFLERFGGLTHEISNIQGQWVSSAHLKVIQERHERYEISLADEDQIREFLTFLSRMCAQLQEESIYVTMGDRSWLVQASV